MNCVIFFRRVELYPFVWMIIFVKPHSPTFVKIMIVEEEYQRYYRMGPNDRRWLQLPMGCIVPFHYQPIMKYWKSYDNVSRMYLLSFNKHWIESFFILPTHHHHS